MKLTTHFLGFNRNLVAEKNINEHNFFTQLRTKALTYQFHSSFEINLFMMQQIP